MALAVVAALVAVIAGPPSGAGAQSATGHQLTVRRVTRDGTTAQLTVSVPPSLRGDTLAGDQFRARAGGRDLPVQASRLAGAALDVTVVIDPVGSATDLAAVQGSAVELILGLPAGAAVTLVTPGGSTIDTGDRAPLLTALRSLTMSARPAITSLLTAVASSPSPAPGRHRVVITVSSPAAERVPTGTVTASQLGGPLESIQVGGLSQVDPVLTDLAEASGGTISTSPTPADLLGSVDQVNSDIAGLYQLDLTSVPRVGSVTVSVATPAGSANAVVPLTSGAISTTTPSADAGSTTPSAGAGGAPAPATPSAASDPTEDSAGRGVHSWNFLALLIIVVAAIVLAVRAVMVRRRQRWSIPIESLAGETKARVAAAQRALDRLARQRRESPVRIPERLLVALEATASVELDTRTGRAPDAGPPDPIRLLTSSADGHRSGAARFEAISAGLTGHDDREAAAQIAALLPHRRRLGLTRSVIPEAHTVLQAARQAARVSRAHSFGANSDQVGRSLLATWPAREGVLDHVPTLVSRALIDAGVGRPEHLGFDDHVSLLVAAVGDAANRTVRAEVELTNLRNDYVAQLEADGESDAGPMVAMLVADPIVTLATVRTSLQVSADRAREVIDHMVDAGWLARIDLTQPTFSAQWVAAGVVNTVTAAFDEPTTTATFEESDSVHLSAPFL
jgi:hypothetical protein